MTFPGTVASLRQMWGRAGRRGRGLAVYIAGEDALDQFFCRHPDEFLERPVEAAILDHESEQIHLAHLRCAAHEGPLTRATPSRSARAGGATPSGWWRWASCASATTRTSRGARRTTPPPTSRCAPASPDSFAVVDTGSGEVIGTIEAARAFSTAHDGAIYLHLGRSYEVEELDLDARQALVASRSTATTTRSPSARPTTDIERLLDRRETLGVTLSFGTVTVTEQVLGYQRKRLRRPRADRLQRARPARDDVRDAGALVRAARRPARADEFPLERLLGSLHAAEHGQIAVLPLLAMCDRWDIGGLSTNVHPQTGRPTIFIYDGHPGGVGITRQGFREFETLVADAHRLIAECRCRATAARRACSRRSAATSTSRWPRPARASCWRACSRGRSSRAKLRRSTLRVNDNVPTVDVTISFVHIGVPPATTTLDLGQQPTGHMTHVNWKPAQR